MRRLPRNYTAVPSTNSVAGNFARWAKVGDCLVHSIRMSQGSHSSEALLLDLNRFFLLQATI